MSPILGRILIYTKKIDEMVAFYQQHFDLTPIQHAGDRIVELRALSGGASIMLHPASRSQKSGQSLVKLVFDVEDVRGFCKIAKTRGLVFGSIHQADGYEFANGKDPSKNSVQVSSRAFTLQNTLRGRSN